MDGSGRLAGQDAAHGGTTGNGNGYGSGSFALRYIGKHMCRAAGLAGGLCALLAYNGAELTAIAGRLSLFAALCFAAVVAAAATCYTLATRRSALELLQTKE